MPASSNKVVRTMYKIVILSVAVSRPFLYLLDAVIRIIAPGELRFFTDFLSVDPVIFHVKGNKNNFFDLRMILQELLHRADSDLCRFLFGKSIYACADVGKSNALYPVLSSYLQRAAVSTGQQLRFSVTTIPPAGPNSMDDVFRRQQITPRDLCITRGTPVQRTALLQQLRTRRTVDGSIHPSSPQQRSVGSIHYGIYRQLRNVSLYQLNTSHGL